jgi:hypothetical protein
LMIVVYTESINLKAGTCGTDQEIIYPDYFLIIILIIYPNYLSLCPIISFFIYALFVIWLHCAFCKIGRKAGCYATGNKNFFCNASHSGRGGRSLGRRPAPSFASR